MQQIGNTNHWKKSINGNLLKTHQQVKPNFRKKVQKHTKSTGNSSNKENSKQLQGLDIGSIEEALKKKCEISTKLVTGVKCMKKNITRQRWCWQRL